MTLEESKTTLKGGAVITAQDWHGSVAIFFDYITEESNTAEASITDNWVESNYTLQDHIAVKPRIYRLKGFVGEVLYKQPTKWRKALSDWADNHAIKKETIERIRPINSLSGIVSNYTRLAINVADQIESSYDRYKQIYEAFKYGNPQQNLTNTPAYMEFIGRRQRVVSSILLNLLETRTPVELTDLAFNEIEEIKGRGNRLYFIQSVSSRQGDNAFISDYEVTIKEFRIATSQITKVDKSKFAGDVATQKTTEANNGTANTVSLQVVAGKLTKIVDDPQAQMSRIVGKEVKQVVTGNKIYTIKDTGYGSQILGVQRK